MQTSTIKTSMLKRIAPPVRAVRSEQLVRLDVEAQQPSQPQPLCRPGNAADEFLGRLKPVAGLLRQHLSLSLLQDIAAIDHQDSSIHVACAV
jgi:hypothetical protein